MTTGDTPSPAPAPSGPPNPRILALVEMLGEEEAKELVRIYLGSVPRLLGEIGSDDRERARRAAHSLKSSSQQMGAPDIAEQSLGIEKRLIEGGPLPAPVEMTLLQARFKRLETSLRGYAGD